MKSSKKILLAGGAGFIGHHLAIHLADAGHDVTVCDGFSVNNMLNLVITPDKFSNLSLFDYIQGDVNTDGVLNVLDIVLSVNFVLGLDSPSSTQYNLGDMNSDGVLNILDVILLVNEVIE